MFKKLLQQISIFSMVCVMLLSPTIVRAGTQHNTTATFNVGSQSVTETNRTLTGIAAYYTGEIKEAGATISASDFDVYGTYVVTYSDNSTNIFSVLINTGYTIDITTLVKGHNNVKVTYQGYDTTVDVYGIYVEEVEKIVEVQVPIEKIVEKIVEVIKEVEVEIPIETIKEIEKVVEKEVPIETIIEKSYPVETVVEKVVTELVDKPYEVVKEVYIEVPKYAEIDTNTGEIVYENKTIEYVYKTLAPKATDSEIVKNIKTVTITVIQSFWYILLVLILLITCILMYRKIKKLEKENEDLLD